MLQELDLSSLNEFPLRSVEKPHHFLSPDTALDHEETGKTIRRSIPPAYCSSAPVLSPVNSLESVEGQKSTEVKSYFSFNQVEEEIVMVGNSVYILQRGGKVISKSFRFPESTVTDAIYVLFTTEKPGYCNNMKQTDSRDASTNEVKGLSMMKCLCVLLNGEYIKVYSEHGDMFQIPLPFQATKMHALHSGMLIQRSQFLQQHESQSQNEVHAMTIQPILFSLFHPLDEIKPVAIRKKESVKQCSEVDSSTVNDSTFLGDLDFLTDPNEDIRFVCPERFFVVSYHKTLMVYKVWQVSFHHSKLEEANNKQQVPENECSSSRNSFIGGNLGPTLFSTPEFKPSANNFLDKSKSATELSITNSLGYPTSILSKKRPDLLIDTSFSFDINHGGLSGGCSMYNQASLSSLHISEEEELHPITPEIILSCEWTSSSLKQFKGNKKKKEPKGRIFLASSLNLEPLLCIFDGEKSVLIIQSLVSFLDYPLFCSNSDLEGITTLRNPVCSDIESQIIQCQSAIPLNSSIDFLSLPHFSFCSKASNSNLKNHLDLLHANLIPNYFNDVLILLSSCETKIPQNRVLLLRGHKPLCTWKYVSHFQSRNKVGLSPNRIMDMIEDFGEASNAGNDVHQNSSFYLLLRNGMQVKCTASLHPTSTLTQKLLHCMTCVLPVEEMILLKLSIFYEVFQNDNSHKHLNPQWIRSNDDLEFISLIEVVLALCNSKQKSNRLINAKKRKYSLEEEKGNSFTDQNICNEESSWGKLIICPIPGSLNQNVLHCLDVSPIDETRNSDTEMEYETNEQNYANTCQSIPMLKSINQDNLSMHKLEDLLLTGKCVSEFLLNIFMAWHLVYEEWKLSFTGVLYQQQLVSTLYAMSNMMNLKTFTDHYSRDFGSGQFSVSPLSSSSSIINEAIELRQSNITKNVPDIFHHLQMRMTRSNSLNTHDLGNFPNLSSIVDDFGKYQPMRYNRIDKRITSCLFDPCRRTAFLCSIYDILFPFDGNSLSVTVAHQVVRFLVRHQAFVTKKPFEVNSNDDEINYAKVNDHLHMFLESVPFGVALPIYTILLKYRSNPCEKNNAKGNKNSETMKEDLTCTEYCVIGREDLARLMMQSRRGRMCSEMDPAFSQDHYPQLNVAMQQDNGDGLVYLQRLSKLQLRFPVDCRMREVCRLLRSSHVHYVKVDPSIAKDSADGLEDPAAVSDKEIQARQQSRLLVLCKRAMALPVGRGMLTMHSLERDAGVTPHQVFTIPMLSLKGRLPDQQVLHGSDSTTGFPLDISGFSTDLMHWPEFHNGCAVALRLPPNKNFKNEDNQANQRASSKKQITREWIRFNKPLEPNATHGGFLLGLGLNGYLDVLSQTDLFDYLYQSHSLTTIGLLLGMAVTRIGTMDRSVSKMLCLHLPALLPPPFAQIQVSVGAQIAALIGVGYLYQGTCHRMMTEFLLAEIGRGPPNERFEERESYSLSCGLALGLITLRKGGTRDVSGIVDLRLEERLQKYMNGGEGFSYSGASSTNSIRNYNQIDVTSGLFRSSTSSSTSNAPSTSSSTSGNNVSGGGGACGNSSSGYASNMQSNHILNAKTSHHLSSLHMAFANTRMTTTRKSNYEEDGKTCATTNYYGYNEECDNNLDESNSGNLPNNPIKIEVTATGATLALGMMYLKREEETVAGFLTLPNSMLVLECIRPDVLCVRVLSRYLILWSQIQPTLQFIHQQIPPVLSQALQHPALKNTPVNGKNRLMQQLDPQTVAQAHANIVAGSCLAIGLRFAGSGNEAACSCLRRYVLYFSNLRVSKKNTCVINATSKKRKKDIGDDFPYFFGDSKAEDPISESYPYFFSSYVYYCGRTTIETCLDITMISLAMVMAGTGDLNVLKLFRGIRMRLDSEITYGNHMGIGMSIGLLFLNGGGSSLSQSNEAIASLLLSCFPVFPNNTSDNRYHLQAFRHLYVLSSVPRLIYTINVETNQVVNLTVHLFFISNSLSPTIATTPCLVPNLNQLVRLVVEAPGYERIDARSGDFILETFQHTRQLFVKRKISSITRCNNQASLQHWFSSSLMHSSLRCFAEYFCDLNSSERELMLNEKCWARVPSNLSCQSSMNRNTRAFCTSLLKDIMGQNSKTPDMLPLVLNLYHTIHQLLNHTLTNSLGFANLSLVAHYITMQNRLSVLQSVSSNCSNLIAVDFIFSLSTQLRDFFSQFEKEWSMENFLENYLSKSMWPSSLTESIVFACYLRHLNVPCLTELKRIVDEDSQAAMLESLRLSRIPTLSMSASLLPLGFIVEQLNNQKRSKQDS